MKKVLVLGLVLISFSALAQLTVSPIFPKVDQTLTVAVDATGTSLAGYSGDVYIWTWIEKPTGDVNAPTNVNPATAAQSAAKVTRVSPDHYTFTFTPTTFFNQPLVAFTNQIGLLLKTSDWANNKQTPDLYITFYSGFAIQLSQPTLTSFFVNTNEVIPITAYTSLASTIAIKVNGTTVQTSAPGVTTFSYNHTVTETSGSTEVVVEATGPPTPATTSFTYVIRTATVNAARPVGIVDGINYQADQTKVTLSLWAPGKTSVYVIGDFTNWDIASSYQMKKSGEHFWLEISGLTPQTEYAFQYLVDEQLRVADPYADKILDPDDQYIPAATYPGLKTFPMKALSDKWYYNRLAVLQTGQTPYPWVVTNFIKPPKEKLVIYELLIRDYFDPANRNYQKLIDTLSYLKRLGVNAIELMPVTEFNGNESWGYNPTFMFAPDKYYGTKSKFKEFIDKCHQNGIAVIMDMVMNQQDAPNTYVMMDFDFTAFKPTANNKWFNVNATHPYSVFFDMNHESSYTKKYLDTVNYYWLNEYKVDGYRYDLSKGFTQVVNSDVGLWGAKDPSRIAILKRMSDKLRVHSPNAYIILEHFADNSEETDLANYGMMLWSNLNYSYNQNTIGLSSGSDFSWIFYGTRGWTVPHSVGYMESHDEERNMFRNLQQGLSVGNYNVKELNTALERVKAASMMFYTIPGPKMLWQFEELGYDISIDQGGRISPKPVKWDYQTDPGRSKLNKVMAALISLKKTYSIFSTSDVTFAGNNTLQKQMMLKNVPYSAAPATTGNMNAVIVANFETTPKTITVTFPHVGNWYHYWSGGDLQNLTATTAPLTLQPGEARIYTDVVLPAPAAELVQFTTPIAPVLLTVVENDNAVNLTWDDKSAIESSYLIYRRPFGGTFALVDSVAANVKLYADRKGLAPLTKFEYYVKANNPYKGTPSQILSVTTSDKITGLEDEWVNVKVFPNPTRGILMIQCEDPSPDVQLISMQGARATAVRVDNTTWDVSSAAPGLYVVEIRTATALVRRRIVKL